MLLHRGANCAVLLATMVLFWMCLVAFSAPDASASPNHQVQCNPSSTDENSCGRGTCGLTGGSWVCVCQDGWTHDFSKRQSKPCSTCDIRGGYKSTSSGECVPRDRSALKRTRTSDHSGRGGREFDVLYDAKLKSEFVRKSKNTRSTEGTTEVLVLSDHPDVNLKSCPAPSNSVATLIIGDPSITLSVGDYINGAIDLGCLDEKNTPSAFLWQVDGIASRHSGPSGDELQFQFSRKDISNLFDELYIKLESQSSDQAPSQTSGDDLPVIPVIPRLYTDPAPIEFNTSKRNAESYVQILSPFANTAFFTGDSLVVEWDSGYGSGSYDVTIYSDNYASDTIMTSRVVTARVGIQSTAFVIGNWAPYDYYYVYINYPSGCFYCTLTASGDYFWVNYRGKAAVSSPTQLDQFQIGNSIPWSIFLPSQYISSAVYVRLRRSVPVQVDPEFASQTYSSGIPSEQFSGLPFTTASNLVQSSYYYIQVDFNCWADLFCDSVASKYFTITTGAPAGPELTITAPKPGGIYSSGQQVVVQYTAANTIYNVELSLYAERSLGPDFFYEGATISQLSAGSRNISFLLPSGLPASSSYYILFEWNCNVIVPGIFSYCQNARTRPFSINFTPSVTISSPVFQSTYKPGDVLPIRWNAGGLPAGSTLYIAVYEQIPFNPFDRALLSPTIRTNDGVFDYVIPLLPSGSIFNYYVELRYNCTLSSYLCRSVRSREFRIDSPFTASINYNATRPIEIFRTNCTKQFGSDEPDCAAASSDLRPLCKFCEAGGDMTLNITCTDCWARAQVETTYFEFEYSFNAVKLLDLRAKGLWNINVDVEVAASLEYSDSWVTRMNPQPIPVYGKGFRIFGIDFSLGLTADLDRTTSVSLDANGRLTVGADAQLIFDFKIQYGYLWSDLVVDMSASPTFNHHPPTLELNGQLNVTVGLKPILNLGVSPLFSVSAALEPYVLGQAALSVPAFTPSPTSPFPRFGICDINHYARLDASWGLKLHVQGKVISFTKAVEFDLIGPTLLARLCLLREFSSPADLCVSLATLPSTIGVTASRFGTLFLSDITEALQEAMLPATAQSNLMSRFQSIITTVEGAATRVCMTILGAESNTAASLASDLQTLINNPQSPLYDQNSRSVSHYLQRTSSPSPSGSSGIAPHDPNSPPTGSGPSGIAPHDPNSPPTGSGPSGIAPRDPNSPPTGPGPSGIAPRDPTSPPQVVTAPTASSVSAAAFLRPMYCMLLILVFAYTILVK